jgi:hypothetical protein
VPDFRIGDFNRQALGGLLRPLCPVSSANSLLDVNLESLWNRGKRLLLLDVDHTLVEWKDEPSEGPMHQWVDAAKKLGFEICLISNTNRPDRLQRIADSFGVHFVRGRNKPSRSMFRKALSQFKLKEAQAVMIGDQLFTDILGANRTGIEAIWVRRMAGPEFAGTKISRFGESMIRSSLYRVLDELSDEPETTTSNSKPIHQRSIFRQFLKFCIVGGTSFIIDYCVRMSIMFGFRIEGRQAGVVLGEWLRQTMPALFGFADSPYTAAFAVAAFAGACVALLNSFYWNRRWTFRILGPADRMTQFRRFVVISLVGMALNVILSTTFNHFIKADEVNSARIATVLAAGCVAFWNFTGQRLYAFRQTKQ